MANSWAGSLGLSYDALNRCTQLTRPNGINTNYSYDSVSRLLSALHQSGSTTLDGASYTYDNAGNRASKTNYLSNVTEGYTYDLIYQLTQVTQALSTTESYSYDPVGNRLSSSGVPSYNYNPSNELASTSNGSYTYDNNGNALTDATGRTFTWDVENRLVQAVMPGTGGGTTTFKYDPFGRRIQKSLEEDTAEKELEEKAKANHRTPLREFCSQSRDAGDPDYYLSPAGPLPNPCKKLGPGA